MLVGRLRDVSLRATAPNRNSATNRGQRLFGRVHRRSTQKNEASVTEVEPFAGIIVRAAAGTRPAPGWLVATAGIDLVAALVDNLNLGVPDPVRHSFGLLLDALTQPDLLLNAHSLETTACSLRSCASMVRSWNSHVSPSVSGRFTGGRSTCTCSWGSLTCVVTIGRLAWYSRLWC